MRAKTRSLMPDGMEPIIFTKLNKSHEWYWDYALDLSENPKIGISLTTSEEERPEHLTITLTYLDTTQTFHPKNKLEYIKTSDFLITKDMKSKYAIDVRFETKIEDKLLWKVKFEVKAKSAKTYLFVSIS